MTLVFGTLILWCLYISPSLTSSYFREHPTSVHHDVRFAAADTTAHTKLGADELIQLVASFHQTMRGLGIRPWLVHGTLLGWYWGQHVLPWDVDIDVHLFVHDFVFLAENYNMTVHPFGGGSRYLLDINPAGVTVCDLDNLREDGADVIDARWINMDKGTFVDVTAVWPDRRKNDGVFIFRARDGHTYPRDEVYPLRPSTLDGIDVYIPQTPRAVLAREYGEMALTMPVFRG